MYRKLLFKFIALISLMINFSITFAQSGNALSFVHGGNNYITIPDQDQINFNGSTSFTIEAWIQTSGVSDWTGIVAKGSGNPWIGYQLNIVENKISAEVSRELEMVGLGYGLQGTTSLADGNWHHVALVVDRSTTNAKLYVDGNEEADVTNSWLDRDITNVGTMYIGAERGGNVTINGLIDEVRIWNVARTQTQLQNFKGTVINHTTTGLVAYYRFDQGTAGGNNTGITTLLDLTTYHNNGTLHNFTLNGTTSNWVDGNVPLPVELTSFTADYLEGKVLLKWQTATELNNYGFEVERNIYKGENGEAGRGWEKIGFVAGNGNSNSTKQYSFKDENISEGTIQYRLKQIDNNGNFKYSNVIEVEGKQIPNEFALYQNYPNPFNPSTVIKYALPFESKVKITIYSITGELVDELVNKVQSAGVYNVQFNAGRHASGLYTYSIETQSLDGSKMFNDVKKMILIK